MAVEDRYRPEIRRMERQLVLQILDTAWKDHLLAMDHLRSSVGLRGYAQVDPKVEYKREGMRTFELMWTAVGERVTDLIFRMEQLDETIRRFDLGRKRSDPRRSPVGQRHRRPAASGDRRHAIGQEAGADPQSAASTWDATIRAPAAAARSSRTAACEKAVSEPARRSIRRSRRAGWRREA